MNLAKGSKNYAKFHEQKGCQKTEMRKFCDNLVIFFNERNPKNAKFSVKFFFAKNAKFSQTDLSISVGTLVQSSSKTL